jgi:putative PIN family toxin of toxin-antitoxin system
MRIVADTNTVVSGLLWQGPPRQLLDAGRFKRLTLVTSLSLLAELAEVIKRDKFALRIRNARVSATGLVEDYAGIALVIETAALPHPVARDPDDDQVLACALAARADAIVSGDADLLALETYQDIPILTAAQAVEKIEGKT